MIKTAYVDDIVMDYLTFGEGEKDFVILPGLALKSVLNAAGAIEAAYKPFAEAGYRVFLFDRRKHTSPCSVFDLADETAAVMKALGIRKACLFGASQGGMMAQVIAARYPELVSAMALGSTLSRAVPSQQASTGNWIRLAEEKDTKGLAESSMDMLYSEKIVSALRGQILPSLSDPTEEELSQFIIMAKAAADFDVSRELAFVRCPVFVLGSFGDKLIPVTSLVETAQLLSGELFIYDKTYGHAVYDEAPDYRARLLEFFGRAR